LLLKGSVSSWNITVEIEKKKGKIDYFLLGFAELWLCGKATKSQATAVSWLICELNEMDTCNFRSLKGLFAFVPTYKSTKAVYWDLIERKLLFVTTCHIGRIKGEVVSSEPEYLCSIHTQKIFKLKPWSEITRCDFLWYHFMICICNS